ncbi:DUF6882 domain-containing protein [Brevibacterium antiquum]|uniref:Uncharacterized protein n=1 Tax=Brevibacterium antiquum TaxID=234835 RepID=A0A2H1IFJ5_9MICO|nr:DUF6882 domain-containing protein [Brevibacterium antiquum]SMX73931.1 hypothetical protein BANT10_00821 [Brevibacterium antiquum]
MSTTLQDLVNRAVFFSTEMQTHFGALIADAEWEVDFTSDPHLTFTSAEGTVLRGRPHLLGSESNSQSTWLWGWENINEFPETVVGLAHDVRKFGAAEDVAEFITEELPRDEELALRLTLAAKEVTGKWAHYPAAAGAGTTVWLLVDAPELALPEPQVKTTVRALMQGLTQTTVTDHRAALESYVTKRGIPTAELPEDGLRLLFADGSADLSFDEQRRISNCEMGAPLEGEAARQHAQATGTAAPAAETADSVGAQAPAAATTQPPASKTSPVTEPAPSAQAGTEDEDPAATDAAASASTDATTSQSPAESTAEVSAADAAEKASVHSTSETRPEQPPVDEPEPAAASAAESQDSDRVPKETEATPEEPKKKGLFSKLFGR